MVWFRVLITIAVAVSAGLPPQDPGPAPILRLDIDNEAITPVSARVIARAIDRAEHEGAQCLVVVLDTPGGLVDSTRTVVKEIIAARSPVVVFVPAGGRAGSAGVFITLAAHVAAMGPGSNIGAAHPVQIGGLPVGPGPREEPDDDRSATGTMEEKAVNDTSAWARSLAELRGRNAAWAEQAVRESRSATAAEARQEGVVDLLADDFDDLLAKLDGYSVEVAGRSWELRTLGAEVRPVDLWWGDRLLLALGHPNLAFLLLILGFYGILFEFYSPGWGVAGTLGVVALVLAFFGLAVLPINYAGLALIVIALGMFVAEAFLASYGALALGGVICLVIGGVMLVDSPVGFLRVSLGVVIPAAAATAAIAVFLLGNVIRAHRARVLTGSEGLRGQSAVAIEEFDPMAGMFRGRVRIHGEYWNATCPRPVGPGDLVEVKEQQGLTLHVETVESKPVSV